MKLPTCAISLNFVVAASLSAQQTVPFDTTTGWVTVGDADLGGAVHTIVSDPLDAGNNVSSFSFPDASVGFRLYDLGTGIADGASDFIEFRFQVQSSLANTSDADFWFGFTDLSAGDDWINSFSNMEANVGIREDGSGTYTLFSRDGGTGTTYTLGLAGDTWHTLRIDINNSTDTYDLTLNGSPLDSGLGFRTGNGDAAAALVSFSVFGNNGLSPANPVLLDAVPEPSTFALVLGVICCGLLVLRRRKTK